MPPHAPPPIPELQEDAEHLKLLTVFHYVFCGLLALGGLFPVFHVVIGLLMVTQDLPVDPTAGVQPPVEGFGWLFVAAGVSMMLLIWAFGILQFLAGRYIRDRRFRTFCVIVAGINCVAFPLGTTLGVLSVIVLQRPTVRSLFKQKAETHLNS